MPPVSEKAAASSARASTPNMQAMPPAIQTASMMSGERTSAATVAGTMKMPEPIMVPTTMLTMLPVPRQRTRGVPGGVGSWCDMRTSYGWQFLKSIVKSCFWPRKHRFWLHSKL